MFLKKSRLVETALTQSEQLKVEPLLLEVADVVNTTLDLDTTLRRVAELVRKVIDYEIFAILLVNEKAQDLTYPFPGGICPRSCRARQDQDRRRRHRTWQRSGARPFWSMTCRSIPSTFRLRPTCAPNWRFH